VEAASESYFNKRVETTQLAEMALMAGLVKAPSRYSPVNNLKRLRMTSLCSHPYGRIALYLPRTERKNPSNSAKNSTREVPIQQAPYFTEFIRRQVERNMEGKTISGRAENLYDA